MRIIGLTGSIACGKSTVSSFLISRGFPVIDGDRISRELTVPGSPVLQEIYSTFGPEYFSPDGSLNRRRLGQLVFSDPRARQALDDLMAPHLLSATRRHLDECRASGAELCFLDMPLLYEKGYDRLCDAVWVVWLPENVQISRLMARDGFTREEAVSRIRAVLSSDEKAALADRVIDNSGSVQNTYGIVSDFLSAELQHDSRPRSRRRSARSAAETFPAEDGIPPVSGSLQRPETFDRPDAARIRRNTRKVSWRMPVWLKASLISCAALLVVGFTALMLMNAYLTRCAEQHAQEQANIDWQYQLPSQYRELIEKYAAEYNLEPAYVSAIIRNESSFRPTVESGDGARGLMQLMPDTAEWIARKLQVSGYAFERMNDPESNIQFGCWYLNYLSRLFLGNPVSVTAAYHAGQGQVQVWLSDPLLSEDGYALPLSSLPDGPTKNYAGRVTRDYGIYQEKYFSDGGDPADSGAADSGVSGEGGGDR